MYNNLLLHGFCKPHFGSMKLPKVITITVADSPEKDRKHNLNKHFEILVRKMLNIFARNPSEFAALHSALKNEVAEHGLESDGLQNERLLTQELVNAIITNPRVSSPFNYYILIIILTNFICTILAEGLFIKNFQYFQK